MSGALAEILTFGRFAGQGARRRVWIEPGRAIAVGPNDLLRVDVDRVNGYDQVMLHLDGFSVGVVRHAPLALECGPLNLRAVARAMLRYPPGRGAVASVLVEVINISLMRGAA